MMTASTEREAIGDDQEAHNSRLFPAVELDDFDAVEHL